MTEVALRLFIFTLFPLLLAGAIIRIDTSVASRSRKLELVLIFLFAVGVAGSGIFNFVAHFFISDVVAKSIGWEIGSLFQLEVAFANLALGALGLVATGRRDGFREATVIAVTVFAVGATIVHIMDIVAMGNLAPGNTLQNVANLLRPALLIGCLTAARRAEGTGQAEEDPDEFARWKRPLLRSSAPLNVAICTGYGLGFALGQTWLYALIGAAVGIGIVTFALVRSPGHGFVWSSSARRRS